MGQFKQQTMLFVSKITPLWTIGIIVSIYVISTNLFHDIRIPFSIWDEARTETFNYIITSLSISYITGMLVYGLTVVYKNKKERKKRRGELENLVTIFNRVLEPLENEIDRFDNTDEETLKNSDDAVFNTFRDNLTKTLDRAYLYKDIMSEKECEKILDIRRALGILINPPSMMDGCEAERCLQALRDIRTDIDELQKSVYCLMKWNNKKQSKK